MEYILSLKKRSSIKLLLIYWIINKIAKLLIIDTNDEQYIDYAINIMKKPIIKMEIVIP